MKKLILFFFMAQMMPAFAQLDSDQLSLDISKAEAANLEQLKQFIWRRATEVTVDGQVKLNALSELSFDETGKLEVRELESESTVKTKPGLRGNAQKNAMEDNMEYVEKAMGMSIAYTYMSKGELIDFFSKAAITESNGVIKAVAKDVQVKGDVVTFLIDAKTNLFVHKTFSSLLGADPFSCEVEYDTFNSGVSHATKSVMKLDAKKAVITSVNKDYSQKIQ